MSVQYKTEDGIQVAYKDFTYTYMGEERTAHYATGTDVFEIGGVVDTVELERVVEENSGFMQSIFQNMDGHVDPMEYSFANHGSGA